MSAFRLCRMRPEKHDACDFPLLIQTGDCALVRVVPYAGACTVHARYDSDMETSTKCRLRTYP